MTEEGDDLPPIVWRESSRAQRVSLRLEPASGHVLITLPPGVPREAGLRFLRQSRLWLEKALEKRGRSALETGVLLLEGIEMKLVHREAGPPEARLSFESREIILTGTAAQREIRLRRLVKNHSRERLGKILNDAAAQMDLKIAALTLRDARSRWGSCTLNGRIMLNWRLVFAPRYVQIYVAVHELAHLKHFNHSKAFWALVDRHAPGGGIGRREARNWLKANSLKLHRLL